MISIFLVLTCVICSIYLDVNGQCATHECKGSSEEIDDLLVTTSVMWSVRAQRNEQRELFACTDPSAKTDETVCPVGFNKTSQNNCYTVVKEKLDWNSSRNRCQQLHPGAHLVVISDAAKQADINSYLNATRKAGIYWTGGYSTTGCGNFTWQPLPGKVLPMTYTNWLESEPDCRGGKEPCLGIRSLSTGEWRDYKCHNTTHYPLCEFERTPE